jgi:undecaprenyl-diphosphatase
MQSLISYLSDFDSTILYAVQSIGPAWRPVAHFISYGVGYHYFILAGFLASLLILRKWRVAFELVAISAVSYVALLALKHYFAIERPYLYDALIIPYVQDGGFALPSGHALMSVVILGWTALRHPKSHVLLWGSVALIVLIGVSRIYLGVHYPTQVVAGWLFGILFLYIFKLIDKRLWSPFQKKFR